MTDSSAISDGGPAGTGALIDSHCHVSSPDLVKAWAEVLARAAAAGVEVLVDIGTDVAQSREVVARAEAWQGRPAVFAGVGLHPNEAAQWDGQTIGALRGLATQSAKVAAIGETGLDFHHASDLGLRAKQAESFRAQMALAAELGKPFVVHSRDAAPETLALLRGEQARLGGKPLKGIMHCFTGDAPLARACVELGLHVSFSGIVTYKNAREIQAAAQAVPGERLLVETDAPYLSPEPLRGNKYYPNEPARVLHTARFLAKLRGETFEALAAQTSANARGLFGSARC
ncbi:MAG: TatD family hydrolase [Planctomycetota bacterium]